MSEFVSEKLRKIEREIDSIHKSNALLTMPFGESAWLVMAAYEDISFLININEELSRSQSASVADNIVVQLQHPLLWLWQSSPKGGIPQQSYDDFTYEEASRLIQLAQNYDPFYLAYTYASHGWSDLRIENNFIVAENQFLEDLRYEAYSRLIQLQYDQPNNIQPTDISERLQRSLSVSGERFTYKWGRRIISDTISLLEPVFETIFELPSHWEFENYSLLEFRRISKFLVAWSFLHKLARTHAAKTGIKGLGYSNSLIVTKKDRLLWLIMRYGNVSPRVASSFLEDFTYGNREIHKPDPAIQPLIQVNQADYILMPSLLLASSMERNFVVLINKIPSTQKIYSHLVNEKENSMRQIIISGIDLSDVTFWHGKISNEPSLPDIDLAIISQKERVILVTELKWFLSPSEPREIIEKSEEIQKGINQLVNLKRAFLHSPEIFYDAMELKNTYELYYLVISENYIGTCIDQNPEIPVIQRKHFVAKFNELGNSQDIARWLKNRDFLPRENVDFSCKETISTVGSWNLKWYMIDTLIGEPFSN